MQPQEIERLFTRSGEYFFARWGRPLAPIVFGVEDETLSLIKGAFEALCTMSAHTMTDGDPELGANVMMFFFRDWEELLDVPDLGRMVDGLETLVPRLQASGANQYRAFRFDKHGAIKASFVFLRMDAALSAQPAEELALSQAAQVMLAWGEAAFSDRSPLAQLEDGRVVLHPQIAALLRAAYDPVLPVCARDASHALRLAARI
ncbi:hypothetical protein KO516_09250 [Citreicella sp. C3M06]|uniref:hypothetical protein n=1 Tax=Citreicella sp. C3M06 TaxID=2841564 RepID=UPI001C090D36|nr:hypothetical protein [Citreicella sp. C3M06]MBU2960999.1 hypothetical protein [Citreicella sp. C3M06]